LAQSKKEHMIDIRSHCVIIYSSCPITFYAQHISHLQLKWCPLIKMTISSPRYIIERIRLIYKLLILWQLCYLHICRVKLAKILLFI